MNEVVVYEKKAGGDLHTRVVALEAAVARLEQVVREKDEVIRQLQEMNASLMATVQALQNGR